MADSTQPIKSRTFGSLEIGTVLNFNRCTTADDTNYAVLGHVTDSFGNWTEVLNLITYEKDLFTQHTEIKGFWSIVKEQK